MGNENGDLIAHKTLSMCNYFDIELHFKEIFIQTVKLL